MRELRLLRARQQLQGGMVATVREEAYAVGFVNVTHFGRVYVRHFSHLPGQEKPGKPGGPVLDHS